MVSQSREKKKEIIIKKELNPIHQLNINTYNNYYVRLNGCDNIRNMLKRNCTLKAPSKEAIA